MRCGCFYAWVRRKVFTGMTAQWTMILLMSGLPLAMVDIGGYRFDQYAFTIQIHLLGGRACPPGRLGMNSIVCF